MFLYVADALRTSETARPSIRSIHNPRIQQLHIPSRRRSFIVPIPHGIHDRRGRRNARLNHKLDPLDRLSGIRQQPRLHQREERIITPALGRGRARAGSGEDVGDRADERETFGIAELIDSSVCAFTLILVPDIGVEVRQPSIVLRDRDVAFNLGRDRSGSRDKRIVQADRGIVGTSVWACVGVSSAGRVVRVANLDLAADRRVGDPTAANGEPRRVPRNRTRHRRIDHRHTSGRRDHITIRVQSSLTDPFPRLGDLHMNRRGRRRILLHAKGLVV